MSDEFFVCIKCVHAEPLVNFISHSSMMACCSYCGSTDLCAAKDILFTRIEKSLEECLRPTDELTSFEQAMIFDCGSDDVHVMPIWEFLSEQADIGTKALVDDLIDWLGNDWAVDERGHEKLFAIDDGSLEENRYEIEWAGFVDKIHYSHRFFNAKAKDFLDAIFEFSHVNGVPHENLIERIENNQSIYRARVSNTSNARKKIIDNPGAELGPAPRDKASSQRMTPTGISAMYCARDRNTCLSEIRAITGDCVVSGEFRPLDSLRILDLRLLGMQAPPTLHFLDSDFNKAFSVFHFMKGLMFKMSKPKGRQDELAYLSTQVIFEYLRLTLGESIDGLMLPSVQTGLVGANIILFPEASVIAPKGWLREDGNMFYQPPKLVFQEGTLVFHKIESVTTFSKDYDSPIDLDMDEITKKRLRL